MSTREYIKVRDSSYRAAAAAAAAVAAAGQQELK